MMLFIYTQFYQKYDYELLVSLHANYMYNNNFLY